MTKVVKYLRELSIVVIGVAITLMASTWISGRSESKDLRRSLAAVKFELEENLSMLEEKAAYFGRSVELSTYLSSDKPENLSLDTIYSYKDILSNYFFLTYKKGSMEMFKTGGYMQLVSNKELLSNIWECYAQLEQLKQECDYYMLQKAKET